jgi:DNA-binding NarL/FixJ family response regulator
MKLSGQHAVIVEYVLRGMSDKQIETAMGICHSTLRTYFDRIAFRSGMRGRSAILRRVLAVSQEFNA